MKTTSMLSQLAKVKGVTLCTLLVGIVAGVVNAVQPFLLKKCSITCRHSSLFRSSCWWLQ